MGAAEIYIFSNVFPSHSPYTRFLLFVPFLLLVISVGIVRQWWGSYPFALKHLTRCFPSCWRWHLAGLTVRQLRELNWQENKHKNIVFCQHSSPVGKQGENHNTTADIQQVSSGGIAWFYPKPSSCGPSLLCNTRFLGLTSFEHTRTAPGTAPFPAVPGAVNIERIQPAHGSYWGTVSTACDLRNASWTAVKFLKDSAETRSQCVGLSRFQLLNQTERKRAGIQSVRSSELAAPADASAARLFCSCKQEVTRPAWLQLEMAFFSILPLFGAWAGF